jgi:ribosomal protein S25
VSSGSACIIPLWIFIPLLASLGLFIGALIYSLLFGKEKTGFDKRILLKFFDDPYEKTVFQQILENKTIKQYEIVKKTKLDKVRVHRILKKFEKLGLIKRVKKGKILIVELDEEIVKILS